MWAKMLAGWLLCALLAGAWAQDQPAPIVLSEHAPTMSLDGRSVFWIDAQRYETPDSLEAGTAGAEWTVRSGNRHYNIDNKALWLRFDATVQDRAPWFLELASSGLDRAQLFYRGRDGRWVVQEAGDSRAVSQWPVPGRFPTFMIASADAGTVRYWLRVEHARVNFATPVSLYSQATIIAAREREQFLLGAYFGLAALIMVVSIANAVVFRDRNFAGYALYVGALSAGQLAYLGVGAQHVWDSLLRWNALSTFLLPGISSAVGLWFVRTVTEPARFSRRLDVAVWVMIAALLLSAVVDAVVSSRASYAVEMVLIVVSLAVVAVLIGLVWAQGDDPHIRVIALGFLPVGLMALFPLARGLNLIPSGFLTRYGLSIGAALEMPILFYALALRGTRRREAQVRASALSHTDPLTGLAHMRSLLARLEGALARAGTQGHRCALLVVRLANHDTIVAQHGKDTGDRAMVLSASRLRRSITDVDLAARVGDQHFALLLEGPTTDVTAQACATRVVASGLRESEVLPMGVTLRFHVAAAMLPDSARDAVSCLQWLTTLVDDMPADTRKSIRSANF